MIADDHDRWVHKIPESSEWALAVQTLGGISSYREILKLREPRMSRKLRAAFESGQDAMRRSLELAQATMVDRKLDNGITVRTACCFGYSSEVAAHLYQGQTRTVVALFDLRSQGVSLRRSSDSDVDLSRPRATFRRRWSCGGVGLGDSRFAPRSGRAAGRNSGRPARKASDLSPTQRFSIPALRIAFLDRHFPCVKSDNLPRLTVRSFD